MKWLLVPLLLCTLGFCAQDAVPPGTVLPAQLNSSLDSAKNKPGQVITARIMQDVPLGAGKIPAGAKVIGRIVSVGGHLRRAAVRSPSASIR